MERNKQVILAFMFVFIIYRTVSFLTIITIQAQRNRSELFKIITVYLNKGPVVYYVCVGGGGGGGRKLINQVQNSKLTAQIKFTVNISNTMFL